ncbi:MAG TPA: glycosyltransferase family 4 protein [Alicyclobacillus sp.]|nr:glycosyltransferase family 4 protein [Alicyclobacillus sp.]
MRDMRLLEVTTVAQTLRSFLLPHCTHLQSLGWKVDALAAGVSRDPQCVATFDRVFDAGWSRTPNPILLRESSRVRDLVETGQYDIVHVHTPIAGFLTRFALRSIRARSHVRVVYTAHGFHFHSGRSKFGNLPFEALERVVGRWTDMLITINRDDFEAARFLNLVPEQRLRYVPGVGIDLQAYNPEAISPEEILMVRNELRLTPADYLFTVIAEFTPNKRHRDIIRALRLLGNAHVHVALAGEGRTRADVEQLAQGLKVNKQVHFLGYRTDIPRLMSASNAVLLVSTREGLPRTVMEAMAMGRPVIGSNVRGIRDLLSGGSGLLVPVGDVEAIANAMRWILDHPSDAEKMGKRGRQEVRKYRLDLVLSAQDQIYSDVLGMPARG